MAMFAPVTNAVSSLAGGVVDEHIDRCNIGNDRTEPTDATVRVHYVTRIGVRHGELQFFLKLTITDCNRPRRELAGTPPNGQLT